MDHQPSSTVAFKNATSEELNLFLAYTNKSLAAPGTKWVCVSSNGKSIPCPKGVDIKPPVDYGPTGQQPANDAGAGQWQVLTMESGANAVLQIPEFKKGQAWSIRPVKKVDGEFCTGAPDDCGMPILIETGKDMVGDMSAVDGVNYLLDYSLTSKGMSNSHQPRKEAGTTRINFSTNPCRAIGDNVKGCRNPSVDGMFKHGTSWKSKPCYAGDCNLEGQSKKWCDAVHTGQSKPWTYCYSHDDSGSSPTFDAPYKIALTYSDLD